MLLANLANVNDPPALAGMRGIFAKLRKMIRIGIPIGYQDETGFHLGVKPAEKEVIWPPMLGESKQGSISPRREFESLRE
jgi:hypothetical protein